MSSARERAEKRLKRGGLTEWDRLIISDLLAEMKEKEQELEICQSLIMPRSKREQRITELEQELEETRHSRDVWHDSFQRVTQELSECREALNARDARGSF